MSVSPSHQPIEQDRIRFDEAQFLVDHHWGLYEPARKKIREARETIQGDYADPVPKDAKLAGVGAEEFSGRLPHETTEPLKTLGLIGARRGEIKRNLPDESNDEAEESSGIERWSNAGMEMAYPDRVVDDLLLNEAHCLVTTLPQAATWLQRPTPYEVDADGTRLFQKAYQRDERGRSIKHDYYAKSEKRKASFKPDESASARVYEKDLEKWLASRFPIEHKAHSLLSMAPINPQFVGLRIEIEGAIIIENLLRSELIRRRIRWCPKNDGVLLESVGSADNGDVELITLILKNEFELPYLAYFVRDNGELRETKKLDRSGRQLADHYVDLAETWGIRSMPAAFEYGWCWPGAAKVADRGIPFAHPFKKSWKAASAIASGVVAHTWLTGYGGWFVRRQPGSGVTAQARGLGPNPSSAQLDAPAKEPVKVTAFGITELEADEIIPAVHQGPTPMALQLIDLFLGATEQQGTPGGAVGRAAASGVDRALITKQVEMAMSAVLDSRLQLKRRAASTQLEIGCMMGRGVGDKEGIPVPVYRNVPKVGGGGPGIREIVTLDPDDVGDLYDLDAIYQARPGDNMALASQLFEFFKARGITWREWREWGFGDPSPEVTRGDIIVDRYYDGDLGFQEALEDAANRLADEKLQKRLKLIAQQKMLPSGIPAGLTAGVAPPPGQQLAINPPAGGAPVAPMGQDPGQNSLNASTGAAMTASRAANQSVAPFGM